MPLQVRKLGKNGPEVTALGFGCMGLSAFYTTGKLSYDDSFKVLDHVVNSDCTFWDSSDLYADNEDLLGEWFKKTGRRNEIFLATKFGNTTDKEGRRIVRGDPEYVREACERSMRRLGVDVIDLYYAHRIDRNVPIEKTVGAMAELVKEGKVRYLGLSECSASTLRRAHAVHPIAAVQLEYSPFALEIESDQTPLLKAARELGIAIVAYSPLGRGLLTGKYKGPEDFSENDVRRSFPRFSTENFPKNMVLVEKIAEMAKKKGVSPGELTLAWILAQGEDFIPIPGTKKIAYFDENLAALKVPLSTEEVQEIRQLAISAQVAGTRYPAAALSATFGDTPPLEN